MNRYNHGEITKVIILFLTCTLDQVQPGSFQHFAKLPHDVLERPILITMPQGNWPCPWNPQLPWFETLRNLRNHYWKMHHVTMIQKNRRNLNHHSGYILMISCDMLRFCHLLIQTLIQTNHGSKYIWTFVSQAWLVGGFNPSENMKVNWDDYSQYMEK